ncbi:MAG: ABC transporter ATP-binding protein [Planctomycetes bacterium]|nr:ABC transporter ATP-binding protein [Planctomycetota bacterium]
MISSRTKRVAAFIVPYWAPALLFLVVLIVSNAIGMGFPMAMKFAIDEAIGKGNESLLYEMIGVVFVVLMLGSLLSAVGMYVYTGFTSKILFDMRFALFRKLQRLPLGFFLRTKLGDVASRITGDIAEVQTFATRSLYALTNSTLQLAVATAALLWLDWPLFLLTVVFVPLSALGIRPFRSKLRSVSKSIREQSADIEQFLFENVTGMKTVRSSGAQSFEGKRYVVLSREWILRLLRSQRLSAWMGGVNGVLIGGALAIVCGFGGAQVIHGTKTLGSLVAFSTYLLMLIGPAQSLMTLYIDLQKARASMDRVFEYLDKPEETPDRPRARRPSRLRGEVEFRDVSFAHEPGAPTLDHVSFRVPEGETLAIVGATGAGKSTILDLLLRFYEPSDGAVLVDGVDLREYHRRSLVRRFAVVAQDPILFHATIDENLRYGNRAASAAEIAAACRAARIHDFIASLPDGFRTIVGERGMRLSGGERQRLAIARALLRRPDVLLFDEATSALDPTIEREILDEIDAIAPRPTRIFVTHRLSVAARADEVIVIAGGRIVERGSHERLVASGGAYARLHAEQEIATR